MLSLVGNTDIMQMRWSEPQVGRRSEPIESEGEVSHRAFYKPMKKHSYPLFMKEPKCCVSSAWIEEMVVKHFFRSFDARIMWRSHPQIQPCSYSAIRSRSLVRKGRAQKLFRHKKPVRKMQDARLPNSWSLLVA